MISKRMPYSLMQGIEERDWLAHKVGALLYTPALNNKVVIWIQEKRFGHCYSLALCLEDSIGDLAVKEAEEQVISTIIQLYKKVFLEQEIQIEELPMIFIRVRNPEQMKFLFSRLEQYQDVLTGFILPKYNLNCSREYIQLIQEWNQYNRKRIYIMPILESEDMIYKRYRYKNLYSIKKELDEIKQFVLNIRIGGNDFCNQFGVRRHVNETIFDVGVIRDIIIDIVTVFSREYVVSSVVWEYFSSANNRDWKEGLQKELKLDCLNGLIGKTAIHPMQIPIIIDSLRVEKQDYEDAKCILGWNNTKLGVEKSRNGDRMNEVKTHGVWAKKVMLLKEIYGVREE